jgi:transposase
LTSDSRAKGRFVKQDFRYAAEEDAYICPAGERLVHHYTNQEKGLTLRRCWTTACQGCALKDRRTMGKERRIGETA